MRNFRRFDKAEPPTFLAWDCVRNFKLMNFPKKEKNHTHSLSLAGTLKKRPRGGFMFFVLCEWPWKKNFLCLLLPSPPPLRYYIFSLAYSQLQGQFMVEILGFL